MSATCKRGHDMVDGNLYLKKDGSRMCRQCARDRAWAAYQRKHPGAPHRRVETLAERILLHVEGPRPSNGDCWRWRGAINNRGYGFLTHKRKKWTAHRASWTAYHGLVPAGMCVLHTCDVRECVNPDHLWLGTNLDNTRDMIAKGRAAYQCA